ncbi:DinB family protein [Nocardioides jishulii]|uniref:DinB family protein n=1 Tax=Nocardioides jishulii TaxID=2575440 RepID=A0A4U2YV66_9ACTN|nr:DinB family protein [Nocardioides jishulii]QCX26188.1 DinB family protein [Nocardioides jishulii]TKI64011.1 DinB family protein [Nocardioides jishulii]
MSTPRDEGDEDTVRPESGLTDDDFAPIWADDDRPRIPRMAGEREALTAYLEHYRATVEMKCRGIGNGESRLRSVPPSTMSLHGLVRHLAQVERWWFQQNFERRDVPLLFADETDREPDFNPPPDADFAADLDLWRAECAVSRQIVAAHDLDDVARPLDSDEDVNLRWLMLRMITEYARHCGHVDLLREALDGRVGS